MSDPALVRLVVEVEGREFECKVSYNLAEQMDFDRWWSFKSGDVREWLGDFGMGDLVDAVLTCMMRMHKPMQGKIREAREGGLIPAERAVAFTERWSHKVVRHTKGNIVVEADNGKEKAVFNYQTTVDSQQSLVTIHAVMTMGEKRAVRTSLFSYKISVRWSDVIRWMPMEADLHGQTAEAAGIPYAAASEAFKRGSRLAIEGMSQGLEESHKKKSLRKDKDDARLFDPDAI